MATRAPDLGGGPGPARQGLLPGGPPPGQQAPGGPPPGPQAPADRPQANVSPEEQSEYNQFVTNGLSMIYSEEAIPAILQGLSGSGDPVEGVANTAVMIISRLEDSAKQANQTVSPDVLFHGGTELLADLVNLAEQAGIHKFSDEDRERALFRALDLYREMRQGSGQLDEEDLKAQFAELVQADQEGRLDELLPELTGGLPSGGAQPAGEPLPPGGPQNPPPLPRG